MSRPSRGCGVLEMRGERSSPSSCSVLARGGGEAGGRTKSCWGNSSSLSLNQLARREGRDKDRAPLSACLLAKRNPELVPLKCPLSISRVPRLETPGDFACLTRGGWDLERGGESRGMVPQHLALEAALLFRCI